MRVATELYKARKSGLTPKGRGVSCESLLYRQTMNYMHDLEIEADNWLYKERQRKAKKPGR